VLTAATGATGLLLIPLMIQFGIDPRVAIATNMAIMVPMNIGSSAGFHGEDAGGARRLLWLTGLTLAGSAAGALLMLRVPAAALSLVVPIAMFGVLIVLLLVPARGVDAVAPSQRRLLVGYGFVLALGVYGGFFSGGYVTMMVAAFTFFFAYSFLEAIALSRLMNVVSSVVAAGLFAWFGTVNWTLSLSLGLVAFAGAYVGARLARKLPLIWLRRVFIAAVALMALKTLADVWK
jgi:uncharacterized membrane protein YfcA